MAFTEKSLIVTLILGQGEFEGGGNTKTISGLRVSATIHMQGGVSQGYGQITIWGLPLSTMNQLSNVGSTWAGRQYRDRIIIKGGDVGKESEIYQGDIVIAMVDGNAQPEVSLQVTTQPCVYYRLAPTTPISINGSSDVAGMMKTLAGKMGLTFENSGVASKISNAYYAGSAWAQAAALARDAGIEWIVDKGKMIIVPANGNRETSSIPVISPSTGMVGYPVFNQSQVIIRALYNPAVQFQGLVKIESSLTGANGTFRVVTVTYELESQIPNGRWHMTFMAVITGAQNP